jgi:GT2 family glycosyltransferase
MTSSVIIVTLARPKYVQRCLECLQTQLPAPDQIIVVDASSDDLTQKVVENFPGVVYLRNENGFGKMTQSRNIGLMAATGEMIAFIDDDAFAHPGYLAALLCEYKDPAVGAVGGRALNNLPGESEQGKDDIGKLKPNGSMTGNFAADPGRVIEVDHVMGCNMSFRRSVLARLGGFRTDCSGISGVREDSDMCMRVKRLGYKILFTPYSAVDHVGAPQAIGRRFDARYVYYNNRNHLILLIRNFGLTNKILWRNHAHMASYMTSEFVRPIAGAVVRLFAGLWGAVVGMFLGISLRMKTGKDPARHDPEGVKLAAWLEAAPAKPAARTAAPETPQPVAVGSASGL